MANELKIQLSSAYLSSTVTAKVKSADGTVAQTHTLTHAGESYFYGSVTSGLPDGIYSVAFFANSNPVGAGELFWVGNQEVTLDDIYKGLYNNMKVDKDTNTLIVYESDGTTVYRTYDLFDKQGVSTDQDIFEIRNA